MGYSIAATRALQQAIPNNCAAKNLGADERRSLGVQGHFLIERFSRLTVCPVVVQVLI